MGQGLDKIERQYDSIAREYAEAFIGDCLTDIGFEKIEVIEREPYPGVEYQSRRAYVFAVKPAVTKSL